MADDGTVAVASRRPIFAPAAHPRLGRIRALLIGVCAAGILASASQTVLARYVYYRAQDLAWSARKEVRNTVDAAHNWWHHVKKTVAQRDKKRASSTEPPTETNRWVGTLDTHQ